MKRQTVKNENTNNDLSVLSKNKGFTRRINKLRYACEFNIITLRTHTIRRTLLRAILDDVVNFFAAIIHKQSDFHKINKKVWYISKKYHTKVYKPIW